MSTTAKEYRATFKPWSLGTGRHTALVVFDTHALNFNVDLAGPPSTSRSALDDAIAALAFLERGGGAPPMDQDGAAG